MTLAKCHQTPSLLHHYRIQERKLCLVSMGSKVMRLDLLCMKNRYHYQITFDIPGKIPKDCNFRGKNLSSPFVFHLILRQKYFSLYSNEYQNI